MNNLKYLNKAMEETKECTDRVETIRSTLDIPIKGLVSCGHTHSYVFTLSVWRPTNDLTPKKSAKFAISTEGEVKTIEKGTLFPEDVANTHAAIGSWLNSYES